jgi:predicted membrane protein
VRIGDPGEDNRPSTETTMKVIGRLFGVLVLSTFVTMAVAASVAMQRKKEAPAPPDSDADEVDLRTYFGPLDFASTSSAFRGGTVETMFGGGTIDLRGATLHPDGAHLRTTTVFGGGQILVPNSWVVETSIVGLGGVGDVRGAAAATAETDPTAPRLVVDGVVAFGGFGIMSHDPRAEMAEAI